jgi:predicted mannosyl-3-phosphoglycerate phosphatase (HAD superfamily)
MRHAYSLVATDLDGTLLRSDGSVSERTRQTLGKVRATGCFVVIVTARAPLWLPDVLLDLDLGSAYAVCSNGAVVQDFERDKPLLGVKKGSGAAEVRHVFGLPWQKTRTRFRGLPETCWAYHAHEAGTSIDVLVLTPKWWKTSSPSSRAARRLAGPVSGNVTRPLTRALD